jgi:hypothetical protein
MPHKAGIGTFALMAAVSVSVAIPVFAAGECRDASADLFESGKILRLKIELAPEEVAKIKDEKRPYVRCTVVENDSVTYKDVGIKLKGAAGSFREFDDKPALTLNSDKFTKKQRFHGLDKFHLNNSVQDESYLNELICSEIFRAANYPAPRVAHARVWLNGRDVGLYVLKEGFDNKFLERHFTKPFGNLYDGGFCQDLDTMLEKDEGDGPDDRRDLEALALAARDPDPRKRWRKVNELVDMDAFLRFMALERMTCHWDGYTMNLNNYRIYFDPARGGKAVFLPHGMDQMFGDPGMGIFEEGGALISSVVLQDNDGWKKYRKCVHELLPLFRPPDKWLARVDEAAARLKPVLKELGAEAEKNSLDRIREFRERIAQRADNLKEQDGQPDPEFLAFDSKGVARLEDWYTASDTDGVKHEEISLGGEKKGYLIDAGTNGNCVASWRLRVLLKAGTYRLNARCRTKDVIPLDNNDNSAAGIRISHSERSTRVLGTSASTPLEFSFATVEDRRFVELVIELKARKGQAIFEADSLTLARRK